MGRIRRAILLGLLVWLGGVTAAVATVTYNYVGNNFTYAHPPYTTADFVSGSFDLNIALGKNLNWQEISPIAFSFSDGQQTIHSTGHYDQADFLISTDSKGEIIDWYVHIMFVPDEEIRTDGPGSLSPSWSGALDYAKVEVGVEGSVTDNPGTWTFIPEPGTAALLGMGLVGLAVRRRKLH